MTISSLSWHQVGLALAAGAFVGKISGKHPISEFPVIRLVPDFFQSHLPHITKYSISFSCTIPGRHRMTGNDITLCEDYSPLHKKTSFLCCLFERRKVYIKAILFRDPESLF